MSDEPRWEVVGLDSIERIGTRIPIRDRLGIGAFGINAFVADEEGEVIGRHDERYSGHQELYVVLAGNARFVVDGEEADAPAGSLVFVRDPATQRGATGDATILVVGGTPGQPFRVSDWELGSKWNRVAMPLYRERRYEEAAQVVREGLADQPDNAGLHYNLACFTALAGNADEALEHLRRTLELDERYRAYAHEDEDFAALRRDARFEEAVR